MEMQPLFLSHTPNKEQKGLDLLLTQTRSSSRLVPVKGMSYKLNYIFLLRTIVSKLSKKVAQIEDGKFGGRGYSCHQVRPVPFHSFHVVTCDIKVQDCAQG